MSYRSPPSLLTTILSTSPEYHPLLRIPIRPSIREEANEILKLPLPIPNLIPTQTKGLYMEWDAAELELEEMDDTIRAVLTIFRPLREYEYDLPSQRNNLIFLLERIYPYRSSPPIPISRK